MSTGWEATPGRFPWPPANGTAMSAFHSSDADIRWDDPSTLNTGPASQATNASTSIVVSGTPGVGSLASGSFVVINAPLSAGIELEIGGVVVTSVSGPPSSPDEFDGSSGSISVIAGNISASINSGSVATWGIATSIVSGGTVEVSSLNSGVSWNSTTISSSSVEVAVSGISLRGGSDPDTLTIGNVTLRANTSRNPGGRDFKVGPSSFDTAASIVASISDQSNGLGFVTASQSGDRVEVVALVSGTMGNGIGLSTSNRVALSISNPQTYGGIGVSCAGKDNTNWNILGVNVYRSDTGERGPYFRVNNIPVMTNFFRDRTDVVETGSEVVDWNTGWIYRGSAPNLPKTWTLKVRNTPVVQRTGNAVAANSPFDVEVRINGSLVPVSEVMSLSGYVTLDTSSVWDPSTESWVNFSPPTPESVVEVRYYWQRGNNLQNTLDLRHKVFYRLTTVALDSSGTSPTGLIETPLGYSEPISPMNSEKLDYIWREAIRRNRWILEQGGERVKLFIRRTTGVRCDCVWDQRLEEYTKQPLNNCLRCYGTGWGGGYEGPVDIIIGPDDNERKVTQTQFGRRLEHSYEVWIGPTPMVSQRDFLVKQNGERYSIGPVRRTQVRGLILQQTFQIGYLDSTDIRYRVPMGELERLPWPETRYTSPELSSCVDAEPYPVGFDYQATPMTTESPKIPDSREQRGRTPVWQNITYGGKGR